MFPSGYIDFGELFMFVIAGVVLDETIRGIIYLIHHTQGRTCFYDFVVNRKD